MCRLLYVRGEEFDISSFLEKFSEISRNSKEYQGHGWGCVYLKNGEWKTYKNIEPIWEDDLDQFGKTELLVAHARSAFQDKGIRIENNMPFSDGKNFFIFNGELRGVKIREKGRIGAEKIFNYIKRFDKGDLLEAMRKAILIIKKRTDYVRAMNMIIADKKNAFLATEFNDDPGYFTMHFRKGKQLVICSDPFQGEKSWEKIPSGTVRVF